MTDIDDLLAELKAEYEPAKPATISPEKKSSSPSPTNPAKPTSPLNNLLADVKAEIAEEKPQSQSSFYSSTIPTQSPASVSPSPQINHLLDDLQTEYQEQEQLERQEQEKRQKQAALEQQRLEQQRQQRKRQALSREAQTWLKQLNPKSEEGRWFEGFSYSYESKLDAAIAYLEALRETGHL
jgi:hypothetical protein